MWKTALVSLVSAFVGGAVVYFARPGASSSPVIPATQTLHPASAEPGPETPAPREPRDGEVRKLSQDQLVDLVVKLRGEAAEAAFARDGLKEKLAQPTRPPRTRAYRMFNAYRSTPEELAALAKTEN